MKLVTINSIVATADPLLFDMDLVAVLDGMNEEVLPFTYNPADTKGLTPQVKQWLIDNPTFPVDLYVEPPVVEEENTREESTILALIKKGIISEAEIDAERIKKAK